MEDQVRVYVDGLGKVLVSGAMARKMLSHGLYQYARGYISTHIPRGRNVSVQRFISMELYHKIEPIHQEQVVEA